MIVKDLNATFVIVAQEIHKFSLIIMPYFDKMRLNSVLLDTFKSYFINLINKSVWAVF